MGVAALHQVLPLSSLTLIEYYSNTNHLGREAATGILLAEDSVKFGSAEPVRCLSPTHLAVFFIECYGIAILFFSHIRTCLGFYVIRIDTMALSQHHVQ